MTAKKENPQKAGRKSKYRPEFCQDIINYFDVPAIIKTPDKTTIDPDTEETIVLSYKEKANDFPMFVDYAIKIGVCLDTLNEWTRRHPEFSDSYKKAKQMQERNWQLCSMKGLYSPAFTIFMGKNVYGWTDKQQIEVGNIEDKSIKVTFEGAETVEDNTD